jgi:8-oxo-dGTP pyrophosphatase MutT (NUDIX family)
MSIDQIRGALDTYQPVLVDREVERRAAVALVLREDRGHPEVLLIHRADKDGDPWSGHMAFPGGRVDPEDRSLDHAARRETLEEVGVPLDGAVPLGRIDDLQGRNAGQPNSMVISAFVYHLAEPTGDLVLQESEVQHAFYFPLWELANPERHVRRVFHETGDWEFPGIVVGDPDRHVVWGLTYRFVEVLFAAVARPFPDNWGEGIDPNHPEGK